MLGATLPLPSYLDRLNREVSRLNQSDIQKWADLVFDAWKNGRFVFIIGNGGSGTTASHMAEDLGKSTLRPSDLNDESKQRWPACRCLSGKCCCSSASRAFAHSKRHSCAA